MQSNQIRIAFAYDAPPPAGVTTLDTVNAEYEDEATISWLRESLASIGTVVDLPWSASFIPELIAAHVDLVFNITEAGGSRNRESLVPAIAETLGIACTGSDAVGLGISLDKTLTKELAVAWKISTPGWVLLSRLDTGPHADDLAGLSLPVIVKPNTGGSSLGIHEHSRFTDSGEAITYAKKLFDQTGEDVLIEEFVSGREVTVALLERPGSLELFPHAELVVGDGAPGEFYTAEKKQAHEKQIICPVELDHTLDRDLTESAVRLFTRLGCADFARIDFRIDSDDQAYLLEINPLPGLSPYYGIYQIQAVAAGVSNNEVIETIVENALHRFNTPKG